MSACPLRRDAVTSDLLALPVELAPDLLDPVDAEIVAVYPRDLNLQQLVTELSC